MTSGDVAKRRRMKQMEGLLVVARPAADGATTTSAKAVIKPHKVHVRLQPQQLQIAYAALEDQDMHALLGRVDLHQAQLEQTPDGFIIHGGGRHGPTKKLKLMDKDKATIDAWFLAVYGAITEYSRPLVRVAEDDGSTFSAVLSASARDEAAPETVEFELSCQLTLPSRGPEEPSVRWTTWATAADIQAFDAELRTLPSVAPSLHGIIFPRERKRDSLFGGLRKRFVQELREQQLGLYIEKISGLHSLSADPAARAVIRRFLQVDVFYEVVDSVVTANNDNQTQVADDIAGEDTFPEMLRGVSESQSVRTNLWSEGDKNPVLGPQIGDSQAQVLDQSPPRSALDRLTSLEYAFEDVADVEPEIDPVAAKKLHKEIIRTVRELVSGDEDRVLDFQAQTKDFGRGKTSSSEYSAFLLGALGGKQCCDLIPMMARLLPDEEKRHDLLAARAAIIRRTQRRNRRRSKQFSESVVHQKQRHHHGEEDTFNTGPRKVRPKSDSLAAIAPAVRNEPFPTYRSSMIEPRTIGHHEEVDSCVQQTEDYSRRSLPDARRKLETRTSFNMFGETIHSDVIEEEEQSTSLESDENNEPHFDEPITQHPYEPEVKSLPPVFQRFHGNPWVQPPRTHQSAGYAQRVSALPSGHSPEPTTVDDEPEQPNQQANPEENPVLARLRKQGAVNFMLR